MTEDGESSGVLHKVPDWWQSDPAHVENFVSGISGAEVDTLAHSPGGRPVFSIGFGESQLDKKGTANFNSACGARNLRSYYRRGPGERMPVLFFAAGAHGAEVEGMVAALSLARICSTGMDIRGTAQPELEEKCRRCRVVIIPCLNPDGRARNPLDGYIGVSGETMHRYNQGTRRDGSLYGWPGCKANHPMQGDTGILGAYFDDAGVNIMHDRWHNPMSPVTRPLLDLVEREGPDAMGILHSYELPPGILRAAYLPVQIKQRLQRFIDLLIQQLSARGIDANSTSQDFKEKSDQNSETSFNLTSICHHTGALMPFLFESPHGLKSERNRREYTYESILEIHHILFETLLDFHLDGVLPKHHDRIL